jgi:hypothetical protein
MSVEHNAEVDRGAFDAGLPVRRRFSRERSTLH